MTTGKPFIVESVLIKIYCWEFQIASSQRGQENGLFEIERTKEGNLNGNTFVL